MADFIGRIRNNQIAESRRVMTAKLVSSVAIGILAVGLSLFVYAVSGNLLEVTFRVVNLFTVPLFIMFCMAMFVPRATVFGTWTATICSIIVAIGIAFWQNIFGNQGPSFLYIMPASLVTGVLVGMVASYILVGHRAKPLKKTNDR